MKPITYDDGGQCFFKTSDGTEAGIYLARKYGGSVTHLAIIANDRLYLYSGDRDIARNFSSHVAGNQMRPR